MSYDKFKIISDNRIWNLDQVCETRFSLPNNYHPAFNKVDKEGSIKGVCEDEYNSVLSIPDNVETEFTKDAFNKQLKINGEIKPACCVGNCPINYPVWEASYTSSNGEIWIQKNQQLKDCCDVYYKLESESIESARQIVNGVRSFQILACGGGGGGGGISHDFAFTCSNGGSGGGATTALLWFYIKTIPENITRLFRFHLGAGGSNYGGGNIFDNKSIGLWGGGNGQSGEKTWIDNIFINKVHYHLDIPGGDYGRKGGGGTGNSSPAIFYHDSTNNSHGVGTTLEDNFIKVRYVNQVVGGRGGSKLSSGDGVSVTWNTPVVFNKSLSLSCSGGAGYDGSNPYGYAGGGASALGNGGDWHLSGNTVYPSLPGSGGGGLNDVCSSFNGNYKCGCRGGHGTLGLLY